MCFEWTFHCLLQRVFRFARKSAYLTFDVDRSEDGMALGGKYTFSWA